MDERELTAKVEMCNENILRFAKEYVDACLCGEMNSETLDLRKAVEIAKNTNMGEHASRS